MENQTIYRFFPQVEIIQNGTKIPFLEWRAMEKRMVKHYKPNDPDDFSGILWSGNSTTVPRNSPECGWSGELCNEESNSTGKIAGAGAAIGVVLIIATVVALVLKKLM